MRSGNNSNPALEAEKLFSTSIEDAYNYVENFDILETINNVGNDEVFTPVKLCNEILDILPDEVWSNENYKWLNPTDKNGVFLREIALRLDVGLSKKIPDQERRRKHIFQNMLFSIGLTRFTSLVSRRTVYYCSEANRKFTKEEEGFSIGNGTWFDTSEGNILEPTTYHSFDRKGKCIYCNTNKKKTKYSDKTQIEHYAYEFIHTDDINEHLRQRFFGGKDMKFDIIIGNPPYQLDDGGAQASASPIYHLFINQAKKLNPKYISFIIPSRWMSGGKGLDQFRKEMLEDTRIKVINDYLDAKVCFPNNDIKGGVCYFLWDKDHNDKCTITTNFTNGTKEKSVRFLKTRGSDVFIRNEILVSIYGKTRGKSTFEKIVSPRKPYGLSGEVFTKPDKYGLPPFEIKEFKNSLKVYGLLNATRDIRYMSRETKIVRDPLKNIDKYKVFLPRAIGSGALGEPISKTIVGEPGSICTETFISIGAFESETMAINCITYLKTRFFRTLWGIKKITQDNSRETFSMIPMQDFSKPWTDKELYEKYKLSEEEISFIEEHVKEMD